jgi:outer membrane immunogenic protein
MPRIVKTVLAAYLGAGFWQTALCADLPSSFPYATPKATTEYLWTGCYGGGNGSYTWADLGIANASNGAAISIAKSGISGGFQIGCDYQMGALVVGIRNITDWADLNSSGTFQFAPLVGYSANSNTSWFDILTARLGIAVQSNWLFYLQGGGAWTRSDQSISNPTGALVAQLASNRGGWTVGVGTEYMFSPNWSAFIEYNYVNLGTDTLSLTDAGACAASCAVDVIRYSQNVLMGVNFRFSGF